MKNRLHEFEYMKKAFYNAEIFLYPKLFVHANEVQTLIENVDVVLEQLHIFEADTIADEIYGI